MNYELSKGKRLERNVPPQLLRWRLLLSFFFNTVQRSSFGALFAVAGIIIYYLFPITYYLPSTTYCLLCTYHLLATIRLYDFHIVNGIIRLIIH